MLDLDAIDEKLLGLLQTDAGLSSAELADKVGISQSPCWRRIRRMEEAGVIRRRVAIVDREALGFDVEVFVRIKLSEGGLKATDDFEAAIHRLPEVVECHMLLGEIDYRLRVVVRTIADFDRFLRDHLAHLPGVREIESSLVVSEVKNTTALPI
ncbi:MAG: Lrp/AsnC family transcriptional regulator [Pseudomonadota bacterium]